MKKYLKTTITSFALVLIFCMSFVFVGCQDHSCLFTFYDLDGTVVFTSNEKPGTKINAIETQSPKAKVGYDFLGWYSCGEFGTQWFDYSTHGKEISEDASEVGTDNVYYYCAHYKIKESGWKDCSSYMENGDSFDWDNGNYASVALKLKAGDNYIKFNKVVTNEALKYCTIWNNTDGDINRISSLEIYDNHGYKLNDIDVFTSVWENQTQTNNSQEYIIKISCTIDLEIGIMIGCEK